MEHKPLKGKLLPHSGLNNNNLFQDINEGVLHIANLRF